MADVTISGLDSLTPSTGLVLPVSNGSTTGKVTLSEVCGVMTYSQVINALGRPGFTAGQSSGSIANPAASLGGIELYGGGGSNAAFLCFHRPGAFAAYFGLDSDNQFKVGGWSMGANSYVLLHTGNLNSYLLGRGQAWTNVTASRAARTTYYNTTGRTIVVSVQCPDGGYQNFLYVDGLIVAGVNYAGLANGQGWSVAIVPPGSSYYVDAQRAAPRWYELR